MTSSVTRQKKKRKKLARRKQRTVWATIMRMEGAHPWRIDQVVNAGNHATAELRYYEWERIYGPQTFKE